MLLVSLQCVIVVFPDHSYLLFERHFENICIEYNGMIQGQIRLYTHVALKPYPMSIYSTRMCKNFRIIQRLSFPSYFSLYYITATSQRMVKCSMPFPSGAVGLVCSL